MFIRKSDSIVQTIAHSSDVKRMFELHIANMETASDANIKRIKDLQSAAHRFASSQKPLGRFVLYFPAIIMTAVEIQARRAGTDKALRATEFLTTICEERLLTLSMLADAGDEVAQVVRFFDAKDHDISQAPAVLGSFIRRIAELFVNGGCLKPVNVDGKDCHTYTSYAIDAMQEAVLITTQEGRATKTRSLGGPGAVTDEMIELCMSRMASWVRLAIATVRAEFPDWEVMSAFGAFDLSLPSSASCITTSLSRLARVFSIDNDALQSQFMTVRKMAIAIKAQKDVSMFEAWREASLRRMEYRALAAIMRRYGAFLGGSTSGVERTFAALRMVAGRDRRSLSTHGVLCNVRLKEGNFDKEKLIVSASRIWIAAFGVVRLSGARRAPSARVAKTRKRGFEAAFIDDRRHAVKRLAASGAGEGLQQILDKATQLSGMTWAATHDQVCRPQQFAPTMFVNIVLRDRPPWQVDCQLGELRKAKEAEAAMKGHLLPAEHTARVRRHVHVIAEKHKRTDVLAQQAEARMDKRLAAVPASVLQKDLVACSLAYYVWSETQSGPCRCAESRKHHDL